MRPSTSKVLLAAGGALLGATLCWIAWGLASGGDFFAQGQAIAVLVSVIAAAAVGAYLGSRSKRRGLRIAIVVGDLLCILFWVAAPAGWWASSPPPRAIQKAAP